MQEFITAVEDNIAEGDETEKPIEFKLDGRRMRAYRPHEGQLTFMMAAMGRGQTQEQRYAAIINIMLESLDEGDADYFESRLLTRDRKTRLKIRDIEPIFEYLTQQWFRPESEADGEAGGAGE